MRSGQLISGILVILLMACAAATPNLKRSYVLSEASVNGVVIGTITSSGQLVDYRILYRGIGGGAKGYFRLLSDDPSLNGAPIAAELPAGDYEIYDWRIYWPRTSSETVETLPTAPFSIPFHVAPGQAVYIGNCEFQVGALVATCADQVERDLMEFEAFYPVLRKAVTVPQIPRGQLYKSDRYETKVRHPPEEY